MKDLLVVYVFLAGGDFCRLLITFANSLAIPFDSCIFFFYMNFVKTVSRQQQKHENVNLFMKDLLVYMFLTSLVWSCG